MDERERRYLLYIRDSIRRIEHYAPRTLGEFLATPLVQDAITWRLQTIADAARTHLSDEIKGRHPEISWRAVYGFRNIAAHGYAGLQLDRVWEIVAHHLRPLKAAVEMELRSRPKPRGSKPQPKRSQRRHT